MRSADRDGRVRARSIAVRIDKVFREQESLMSCCASRDRTFETSHVSVYLGRGGREWNAPFKSLDTNGCWPTETPSI